MKTRICSAALALSFVAAQLPLGSMAAEMRSEHGLKAYSEDGSLHSTAYATVDDALASPDVYRVALDAGVYTLSGDAILSRGRRVSVENGGNLDLIPGVHSAYALMKDSDGSVVVSPQGKVSVQGSGWLGGPQEKVNLNGGSATLQFVPKGTASLTLDGTNGVPQIPAGQVFQPQLFSQPLEVSLVGTDFDVYGTLNVYDSPGILKTPSLFSLNVRGNGYAYLKEDRENIHGQITVWDNSATFKYGTTTIFSPAQSFRSRMASTVDGMFQVNGSATFTPADGSVKAGSGSTITVNGSQTVGGSGPVQSIVLEEGGKLSVPANSGLTLGESGKMTVATGSTVVLEPGAVVNTSRGSLQVEGTIVVPEGASMKVSREQEAALQGKVEGKVEVVENTSSGGGGGGGASSSVSYGITVNQTNGGTISVKLARASKGDQVEVVATPDAGYVVSGVSVTESNGKVVPVTPRSENNYVFVMPANNVTVVASFVEGTTPTGLPFQDVATSDWFFAPVKYVYEKGLMVGVSSREFAPNATTTRGMIVTTLHSLAGKPAAEANVFPDVTAGQWYANAVNWAGTNGVVSGYENGNFVPNDPITREQLAVILYNYAKLQGYDVTGTKPLAGYTDADQVNSYAVSAMEWALANGLISGTSTTTLSPSGLATRAQAATILKAFTETFVK